MTVNANDILYKPFAYVKDNGDFECKIEEYLFMGFGAMEQGNPSIASLIKIYDGKPTGFVTVVARGRVENQQGYYRSKKAAIQSVIDSLETSIETQKKMIESLKKQMENL